MAADVDEVANRLARTQHGCFSRRQLVEAGVAASTIGHRVRQGRWERRASSVYQLSGVRPTVASNAMIGCLSVPGSVASHDTAAALFGMGPLEPASDRLVHVSTAHGQRREGLLVHRTPSLAAVDCDVLDGVRCTSRARTLVDLAMTTRRTRYREILDRELASGALLDDVVAAFTRVPHNGRPGSALVKELLDERLNSDTIATSELERRFLRLISDHGLPVPVCQALPPWAEPAGIGRVDFLYVEAQLLVEVDGRAWHLLTSAFETDRQRDQLAAAAGWRTLRFTWNQVVNQPDQVVAILRQALVVEVSRMT